MKNPFFMKPPSKKESGFSKKELLIVLVIVATLGYVAITQPSRFMRQTEQSEAKAMLSAVYTAEIEFHKKCGFYTPDLGRLNLPLDGSSRYIVGFRAPDTKTISDLCEPKPIGIYNSFELCKDSAGKCSVAKLPAFDAGVTINPLAIAGKDGFLVEARGIITDASGGPEERDEKAERRLDVWTINEKAEIKNTVNGLF